MSISLKQGEVIGEGSGPAPQVSTNYATTVFERPYGPQPLNQPAIQLMDAAGIPYTIRNERFNINEATLIALDVAGFRKTMNTEGPEVAFRDITRFIAVCDEVMHEIAQDENPMLSDICISAEAFLLDQYRCVICGPACSEVWRDQVTQRIFQKFYADEYKSRSRIGAWHLNDRDHDFFTISSSGVNAPVQEIVSTKLRDFHGPANSIHVDGVPMHPLFNEAKFNKGYELQEGGEEMGITVIVKVPLYLINEMAAHHNTSLYDFIVTQLRTLPGTPYINPDWSDKGTFHVTCELSRAEVVNIHDVIELAMLKLLELQAEFNKLYPADGLRVGITSGKYTEYKIIDKDQQYRKDELVTHHSASAANLSKAMDQLSTLLEPGQICYAFNTQEALPGNVTSRELAINDIPGTSFHAVTAIEKRAAGYTTALHVAVAKKILDRASDIPYVQSIMEHLRRFPNPTPDMLQDMLIGRKEYLAEIEKIARNEAAIVDPDAIVALQILLYYGDRVPTELGDVLKMYDLDLNPVLKLITRWKTCGLISEEQLNGQTYYIFARAFADEIRTREVPLSSQNLDKIIRHFERRNRATTRRLTTNSATLSPVEKLSIGQYIPAEALLVLRTGEMENLLANKLEVLLAALLNLYLNDEPWGELSKFLLKIDEKLFASNPDIKDEYKRLLMACKLLACYREGVQLDNIAGLTNAYLALPVERLHPYELELRIKYLKSEMTSGEESAIQVKPEKGDDCNPCNPTSALTNALRFEWSKYSDELIVEMTQKYAEVKKLAESERTSEYDRLIYRRALSCLGLNLVQKSIGKPFFGDILAQIGCDGGARYSLRWKINEAIKPVYKLIFNPGTGLPQSIEELQAVWVPLIRDAAHYGDIEAFLTILNDWVFISMLHYDPQAEIVNLVKQILPRLQSNNLEEPKTGHMEWPAGLVGIGTEITDTLDNWDKRFIA